MVYLTMTLTILEALEKIQSLGAVAGEKEHERTAASLERQGNETLEASSIVGEKDGDGHDEEKAGAKPDDSIAGTKGKNGQSKEPSLSNPKIGNAISHGQIIDLSRQLKAQKLSPNTLDALLCGSRVYFAPPPPKQEPTPEYKALMARLRREEEARSYHRMTNPLPPMETFTQRFPMSSSANAFQGGWDDHAVQKEEDEVTYADINRQMALIANVLLSILACAGAIWVAAKWWSTPARLALSMSGSLLVGVAEVVVYGGYIRRVGEAKGKEKGVQEIKEVIGTWVVGGKEDNKEGPVLIDEKAAPEKARSRTRKKKIQ